MYLAGLGVDLVINRVGDDRPACRPECRDGARHVIGRGSETPRRLGPFNTTRVVIEEKSRSTHENAVYAKEIVGPAPGEKWVLVTSAYHLPRAVAAFRAVGWPVIPYPVDYKIDPDTGLRLNFSLLDGLSAATLAGKECAGLLGYRLMGWTRELFPAPATQQPAS